MLVLTRGAKESVQIGEWGTVTVLSIRGNNVRLGFEFAKGVKVLRTELEENDSGESTLPEVRP